MVRAFWMLKVSSSKKTSARSGQYSFTFAISAATRSLERLRQGCPLNSCGHKQKVHCAGQRLLGQCSHVRPDETDLQSGIKFLQTRGQGAVALEAWCAGEENQKFVVLQDLDSLFGGDVVRRSVEQARALQHSRGIGQPNR